jgi:hypothetical protein
VIGGNPALLKLARLKFRGALRRQLRKLRSPSGLLFALVGSLLTLGWVGSLLLGRQAFRSAPPTPEVVRDWAQFGIAVFVCMSLVSAITVRGVYLPKQEIERLFSSPISRRDLVRYRMIIDACRSLFGALVIALLTFHRLPAPLFGFLGVMTTVLTLGVLRQLLSLFMGSARGRLGRILEGRGLAVARLVLGIMVWLLIMSWVFGGEFMGSVFGDFDLSKMGVEALHHPLVKGLLVPFRPWATMMSATSVSEFLAWGSFCVVFGLALFEVTARLPIDFREHSLETSNKIAQRISQVRRGGLFTGGKASTRTATWKLPRIFGRGPMGAVAWIKLVSIVRKAGGTFIMGALIVTLVTIFVSVLFGGETEARAEDDILIGTALIGLLGIAYLGSALRFDFRADLDRMVQVKAWPVSPRRIFVATLLPEVFMISGLLGLAILGRMAFMGTFHPLVLLVVLVLPLFSYAWLAVDNAVFLFAPVRFIPGQEGSLHHTGRAIVLVFLRLVIMGVAMGLVGVTGIMLFAIGPEVLGLSESAAAVISAGVGLLVLSGLCALLTWIGGKMLQRFDIARDMA